LSITKKYGNKKQKKFIIGTVNMETVKTKFNQYEISLNMTDILLTMEVQYFKILSYILDSDCSRIYVGSYSCSRYFLESVRYYQEILQNLAIQYQWKVTLVIPVVAQTEWENTVLCLQSILFKDIPIDEIVVNDYGTLQLLTRLKKEYDRPFSIIAGRLFHRNLRDVRYEDYTKSQIVLYDMPMLSGVKAIELDLTGSHMDCSALPLDVEVHMHYPYTLSTCGYVCEFASASLPTRQRFRSDTHCQLECRSRTMEITGDGCSWKQVGRAIYAKNPELLSCNRSIERYIYWPVEEVFA
jgi:hypothetical protein